MHLTRIHIRNLRAIADLTLDLEDIAGEARRRLVLLGANGAGKTTTLEAVAHVLGGLMRPDKFVTMGPRGLWQLGPNDVQKLGGGIDERLEAFKRAPRRASVQVHATLSPAERGSGLPSTSPAPSRGSIALTIPGHPNGGALSSRSGDEVQFISAARAAAQRAAVAPAVFLDADRGALEPSAMAMFDVVVSLDRHFECLAHGRNRFVTLAARLALATHTDRFEPHTAVSRMWKVLSKYFKGMPSPVPVPGDLGLHFELKGGAVVPLHALSEGQRALLLLFGELAIRNPQEGVILIDEVEQHLHPRWQGVVLDALAAMLPTAQFIVTTQSPYIAAAYPDDVVKLGDWDGDGE
jgi:predicted ATPase